MRRIHRPVAEGVVSALSDIFQSGFLADKVIQRHLKQHKKWGSQDRRLFAECVYDIVRWWRRLLVATGQAEAETPDLKAVVAAWALIHDVECGFEAPPTVREKYSDPSLPQAVRESIPDWWDEWGSRELGERWPQVLKALNAIAPVFLRVNTIKTKPAAFKNRMAEENLPVEPSGGEAFRLIERKNVFISKAFHAGLFEVQDLHSQEVAKALAPEAGERVIDACAGAGGKSLHIAALMGNKGRVLSLDVHQKKLDELKVRAARAGASLIETRLIESTKVIKRLHDSGDRVLLDVPCSGSGVVRRNPDSKWRLTAEEVDRLKKLQSEILASYCKMCKPGGRLVYSTCSIMPSENELQVERFLKDVGREFELVDQKTLWPELGGGDGFFIAVMERRSSVPS